MINMKLEEADKGTLAKVRRVDTDLQKLIDLLEDSHLVGVYDRSEEALRLAIIRAKACSRNVLAELGEKV